MPPRKPKRLAPPSKYGNARPLGPIPAGAILSRKCPGCDTYFNPDYPGQQFHTHECGQKFYQQRAKRRLNFSGSQHDKYNLPDFQSFRTPLEVISVPKLVGLEQARAVLSGESELVQEDYGICSGCGGPVMKESELGFSYCSTDCAARP